MIVQYVSKYKEDLEDKNEEEEKNKHIQEINIVPIVKFQQD